MAFPTLPKLVIFTKDQLRPAIAEGTRAHPCEKEWTAALLAAPIRLHNAGLNFAFLRRMAINLFCADTSRKQSLPKKLKLAAWNPDYIATALSLQHI